MGASNGPGVRGFNLAEHREWTGPVIVALPWSLCDREDYDHDYCFQPLPCLLASHLKGPDLCAVCTKYVHMCTIHIDQVVGTTAELKGSE